jgi:cytidyltransferase-like protein
MIYVTNGCFDILHLGHMKFLRALLMQMDCSDCLDVYVNSDKSVSSLKGVERPILSESVRKDTLELFLSPLHNAVTITVCDDPLKMMRRTYTPGAGNVVYVKGDDAGLDGPEAKWMLESGFPVLSIPRTQGYSTSEIIARCNAQKQSS